MNTRRIVALMLSLILMLAVSAGLADSNIFAPLEEETAPAVSLTAPSYGAMTNVAEDKAEKNAEGGTIVTYLNVPASGYNRFGSYLGEHGFFITKEEKQEGRIAYAVSDNQVSFVMIYDPAEQTMQLVYPAGTDHEEAQYPGYTRIQPNEVVGVSGLGRFEFHDYVLNGSGKRNYTFTDLPHSKKYEKTLTNWLPFTFYNTSARKIYYGYDVMNGYEGYENKNGLFTATLVYRNGDGEYSYLNQDYGAFKPESRLLARDRSNCSLSDAYRKHILFENGYCAPLSSKEYAVTFDLTDDLRGSSDGSLAILLDFVTGEKYVLVLRENGTDLGIAAPQAN